MAKVTILEELSTERSRIVGKDQPCKNSHYYTYPHRSTAPSLSFTPCYISTTIDIQIHAVAMVGSAAQLPGMLYTHPRTPISNSKVGILDEEPNRKEIMLSSH